MTITPEKLRDWAQSVRFGQVDWVGEARALDDAAAEIERMRQDIERLTGVPESLMQRDQSTATVVAAQVKAGMKKLKP